ncbi:nucleoside phosphorylase/glycosyltransferase involved in cell wall biosynthesis [Bosea sp. BE125]|uniref:phosphorylase family protein n=1 Tax=Bosea sp. BE125 TaxID=2817909 RepID=UPI0028556D56|nr:glycosyltransferase [Bosea sp. BE125]MDR6871834.1 nucleoside phosphorylase/glycosyltransferase involved in cell wall biosynthesis [Bosea sp. BE125]
MSVERYIFLMNGWSSTAGGIQTVNRELVCALSAARSYAAFSVLVPQASQEEIGDATSRGVELISGGGKSSDDWMSAVLSPALAQIDPAEVVALVGHSSFSGGQARLLRDRQFPGSRLVQFIHMSPLRTEALKEYRQDKYVAVREDKVRQEQELAEAADIVICIGPRLHRYTRDSLVARGVSADRIHPLSCGLAPPTMLRVPPLNPTVLCLGRTDSLGVKGLDIFAYAAGYLTNDWKTHPSTATKPAPDFVVRGVQSDGETFERHLISLAEEVGLRPKLIARPYTTVQRDLVADYTGASIFMMPSREEGFGLVACEGLSQGVPVILSEDSGISELARDVMKTHHLREDPCIVSMRGDAKEIGRRFATAALEILVDEERATSYYQALRERMLSVASWSAGALRFLEILDQARSRPKSQAKIPSPFGAASSISAAHNSENAIQELLSKQGVLAVSLKQALVVIVERGKRPNLPEEIGGIEVVVREVDAVRLSSELSNAHSDGLYFEGQRRASIGAILAAPDDTLHAITAAHAIERMPIEEFEVKLGSLTLSARGVAKPIGLDLALVRLSNHSHSKSPWNPAPPELNERVTVRVGDKTWNARISTVQLTARIDGLGHGTIRNLFEVNVQGALPPGASGALVESANGRPIGIVLATMFETKGSPSSYVVQEFSDLDLPGYSVAHLRPRKSELSVAVVASSADILAALANVESVHWMTRSRLGNETMMGRIGLDGPLITATATDRFGAVGTAIATTQVLYRQMPHVIIHLGFCAGLAPDRQRIGDVLLSTEVTSVAVGALRSDQLFPSIQILTERQPQLRHKLLVAISRWRNADFEVHFGPIAAVDYLIESPSRLSRIKEIGRNLLGIDMESAGFAQAAQSWSHTSPTIAPFMLVVNGITDFADGQKIDQGRKPAANNASRVVIELVRAIDNMAI